VNKRKAKEKFREREVKSKQSHLVYINTDLSVALVLTI